MSDINCFQVSIYSPRWGHDDTYSFELERTQMKIESGVNKHAVCSWIENSDPKWSGYRDKTDNPLLSILKNDGIYPPTIFVWALQRIWQDWRNDELDNDQVESEVNALCKWLNEVSKGKPSTDYLRGLF